MNHNHSYQYHILSCRIAFCHSHASCHSYAISYTLGMYQIVILGTVISGSCTYHIRSVCTRQQYSVLSFRVPVHHFAYITDIISINITSNIHTCKHIYIYDQMLLTVYFPHKQSSSPVPTNNLPLHVLYSVTYINLPFLLIPYSTCKCNSCVSCSITLFRLYMSFFISFS